jgi:DedD protein
MAESSLSQAEREERQRGRRRLIGAVTIAGLMVVLLPMLFDSEPPPASSAVALTIPTRESVPALAMPTASATPAIAAAPAVPATAAAPAVNKAAAKAAEPKAPPPAPISSDPAAAPVVAKVEPAKATSDIKAEAPKAVSPAPSIPQKPARGATEAPRKGFAVQLGAFKDTKRIDELKKRLTSLKVSYFLERRPSADGELVRVRAGPFATRADADQVAKRLAANGLAGSVVALP